MKQISFVPEVKVLGYILTDEERNMKRQWNYENNLRIYIVKAKARSERLLSKKRTTSAPPAGASYLSPRLAASYSQQRPSRRYSADSYPGSTEVDIEMYRLSDVSSDEFEDEDGIINLLRIQIQTAADTLCDYAGVFYQIVSSLDECQTVFSKTIQEFVNKQHGTNAPTSDMWRSIDSQSFVRNMWNIDVVIPS